VYYDAGFEDIDWVNAKFDYNAGDLQAFFDLMTSMYAATDEKHDAAKWEKVEQSRRREGRGIEVGHIFYFGNKYTKAMNTTVTAADGSKVYPEMGSYGVGVSRLVGAVIEASHDDAGIIWPDSIAPFKAAILNLRRGDAACDAMCETLYGKLGSTALYDDREERAGAKFADADLMGHPWQVIVGPRGAAAGKVELKRRATGERSEVSPDEALALIDPHSRVGG
jgi:prolyl-tRNA synthetase